MFKNRKIFSKIWKEIDNDKIILLNGARQVGKTTLMKMIKEKLIVEKNISSKQILWFDLEQSNDLAYWNTQIDALNTLPLKDESTKYYLFIDEFQRASEIGSTLKVIHDHYPHIKMIITGSASWYLNIDESIAGRKIVIPVWPLNFGEFTDWSDNKEICQIIEMFQKTNRLPNALLKIVNQNFLSFLNFGGYPEVVLSQNQDDKKNILQDIVNSYLTRDIKIWNYKANTLQVRKLLSLLSSQIGGLMEYQNLSANAEIGRSVLQNRLELLQNTFIIHLISPFYTNKIKELIKNPKIYIVDTGLRNSLLNNFSVMPKTHEFGQIAENFAIMEIMKNASITDQLHFWRTRQKQEVDIILKKENVLIPIEVKGGNQKTLPSGLRSFIRQYKPEKAYILNWSIVKDEKYQNCAVYFRPLWFADKI